MKKVIFFIIYFLSPLLPISAIYMSNPEYYGTAGFLPMILGATAFTWLNAQLVMSARPKFIDAVFGLDRIFRFHSLMPVIAVPAAFIHKLLKEAVFGESLKTQLGNAAVIVFSAASVLGLVFLIDTLVKKFKLLKYISDYAKKAYIGKYHVQRILHNVTVAGVILIFIHVMLSFSAKNLLVRTVYISYFSAAMGFYLYHKIIMRYFLIRRFTVEKVIEESESMRTLTLRPDNGKIFSYLPGQFGFIRIKGEGTSGEEHPFSLSSEPANNETISMTIKNLGDWTANVLRIRQGSRALITAPYGRFSPLLYPGDKPVILIAGGVGITPMLSILRYYYRNKQEREVILFWGINTMKEMICRDEFADFQLGMKNFRFVPVLAAEEGFDGEKGYISYELVERVIRNNKIDMRAAHFFVCGPGVMQTKIISALKSNGINKRNIHFESFSL